MLSQAIHSRVFIECVCSILASILIFLSTFEKFLYLNFIMRVLLVIEFSELYLNATLTQVNLFFDKDLSLKCPD
jgi:hypothetical protein